MVRRTKQTNLLFLCLIDESGVISTTLMPSNEKLTDYDQKECNPRIKLSDEKLCKVEPKFYINSCQYPLDIENKHGKDNN